MIRHVHPNGRLDPCNTHCVEVPDEQDAEPINGPARIVQMPPSPETSARYWEVHCPVCTTHEGMYRDASDQRLFDKRDEHNARHRDSGASTEPTEPGAYCECYGGVGPDLCPMHRSTEQEPTVSDRPAEVMESGRHRRTDPACHYHREPSGWLSRRRYDRARGKSCELCMRIRALAALPFWKRNGWRVWRDDPIHTDGSTT